MRCPCKFCFWMALALCPLVPQARTEEEIVALLARGRALLEALEYGPAAECLEQALQRMPVVSPETQKILEDLREALKGTQQPYRFVQIANKFLQRLDAASVDTPEAKEARCRGLMALGAILQEHGEVIQAFWRHPELKPEVAPEEDPAFREAVAILKQRRHEVQNLARQLFDERRLPEAEAVARALLNTDEGEARLLLAKACFEQKKFNEAHELLEKVFAHQADRGWSLHEICKALAELHSARGTLADAIQKKLEGVPEPDGILPSSRVPTLGPAEKAWRSKLNLLLSYLAEAQDQYVLALQEYVAYQELDRVKYQVDSRLSELGRKAFRQLIAHDLEMTKNLIGTFEADGCRSLWLRVAKYVYLMRQNLGPSAAELLNQMQADAGEDEAKLYQLAEELEAWEIWEPCVALSQKTLELPPHNTVYDCNAHVRLAVYFMNQGLHEQAEKHIDAVNTFLSEKGGFLLGAEHFYYLEMRVRSREGMQPDALLPLLDDAVEARRIAAARLLGAHGGPQHTGPLREHLPIARDAFRSALAEAITAIEAKAAYPQAKLAALSDEEIRQVLSSMGQVLFIAKDPFHPEGQWAAVEKKFVFLIHTARGHIADFSNDLGAIADHPLTAQAIAFMSDSVWVGTDHGLYMYDRVQGTWSGYAVQGTMRDVPIQEIQVEEKSVRIKVRIGDREISYQLDPVHGRWEEIR